METLFAKVVWVAILMPLAAAWIITVGLNIFFVDPEDWKIEEGESIWQDLKLASMIALPVLNWAVLVTTVIYWFVPKNAKSVEVSNA